jgi:hypothetical protein
VMGFKVAPALGGEQKPAAMVSAPIPSRSSRRVRVMGTLDWSAGIRQPIRKPLNAALFTLWYSITDEPQSLLTCGRINQGNLHASINSGLSDAKNGPYFPFTQPGSSLSNRTRR